MTAGNHTIAAPLTLNYDDTTVTVTPASSTLSVTDDLTATGRSITKAGAGAVQFQNVRAGGLTVDAGSVRIAPNGGPAGTSRVENLNISFGGRLDLADNDLVVDYSGASPIATVRTSIRAAYNSGDWTGDGIATSMGNAAQFGLGYAESGAVFTSFPATFSGQQVDDTSVLIAFARFGDANLDGSSTSTTSTASPPTSAPAPGPCGARVISPTTASSTSQTSTAWPATSV